MRWLIIYLNHTDLIYHIFAIRIIVFFYLSPDDYQQGSTVRIMYVHVPSAWLALLTYAIMTLYSILHLLLEYPLVLFLIQQ